MKIICDNCGAKYSIADEKVKGKVFKIRCKKCQESIVVRGDTQEPAGATEPSSDAGGGEVETKVFDYSGYKGNEPVWYVAVEGGEQQGPYTTDQMKEYLVSGNITAETYVWREGLEDWKLAGEVKEIAGSGDDAKAAAPAAAVAATGDAAGAEGGLFGGGGADATGGGLFDSPQATESSNAGLFDSPAATEAAPAAGGGLFGGDSGTPGDVFSSAPDMSTGGMFSADHNAAATTKDGGGLFDGPVASGSGGDLFASSEAEDGGGIFASTEAQTSSPRVSAEQAMTGQRNENSVLFSLSNLQALASDTLDDAPADDGGAAGSPFAGGMAAAPTGEASGLIDIRAMASSLTSEAEKADDVDEMLSFGGGGFASTLGAPVLTAAKPGGMSLGLKIGIAAGVVVLLIGIVVAVVMLAQKDTSAQDEKIAMLMKQIEAMKSQGASAEDIMKAREELEKTQDEKKAIQSGDVVAANAAEGAEGEDKASADGDKGKNESSSSRSRRKSVASAGSGSSSGSSSKKESASSSSSSTSTKKESAPAAAPSRKKTSALDDLLGGGGAKKKPKKTASSASSSGGGAKLSRQQVMAGMNAVAGSVKRCGAGKSGTFKIRARIEPNGRVSKTQAVGQFAATPAGTCAANAVRRARFPQSSSSTNVTFPFKI